MGVFGNGNVYNIARDNITIIGAYARLTSIDERLRIIYDREMGIFYSTLSCLLLLKFAQKRTFMVGWRRRTYPAN